MDCQERDRLRAEYDAAVDRLVDEFGVDSLQDVLAARKQLEAARIALAEHQAEHGC